MTDQQKLEIIVNITAEVVPYFNTTGINYNASLDDFWSDFKQRLNDTLPPEANIESLDISSGRSIDDIARDLQVILRQYTLA
jgi:hypothetical protein